MKKASKIFRAGRRSGFTLTELLVVVAIIAIVTGVLAANYYGGENRDQVINTSANLVRDLRVAQSNSLGTIRYDGLAPLGGWGIHLNKASSSYLLFADLNGNSIYDDGEAATTFGGRAISLAGPVAIDSISTGDVLDITFSPTAPKAIIYNGINTSTDAEIIFKESISNSTSSVLVNEAGLIASQ